ncbi:MAG: F0F1 ATP synthase subunit delta [Chloroflexota bacterium]|nr:F0F1 ATP synthase subunit delta [Chloroflexota bacterium]
MLKLDWATIAFQIVNFLITAAVLHYVLFRPMTRRMRKRAAERERLRQRLTQERQEVERLRAELEERLAEAEEEAEEIVAEVRKEAEVRRQELLQETEREAERILSEARTDAEQLQQQAMDEFHDRLLDAIIDVSARVISQAAPPEVHDKLIQQLNDRIWEMGRTEIERVETFRRSLGERTPTAHVWTAHPLPSEQQGELARTLSALADRNVDLVVEADPSLGAGIRIRLVDVVVGNTIAGRLEELRDRVSQALREREANG